MHDDHLFHLARKLVEGVVSSKNTECLVPMIFWKNQAIYSTRLGRLFTTTDGQMRKAFAELQKNMVVRFRTATMTGVSGSEIPAVGITLFHWDYKNQRLADVDTGDSQKQDSGV